MTVPAPGYLQATPDSVHWRTQLDDIAHASYNGVSIVDYGITLDSHGHLQIDSDQFNDEMAKNPDGLTSIFVGDNSMVAQMDDLINTYTDSSNGIITLRQQNIDDQMSKIQDEGDQLTDTYNANYDRYLESTPTRWSRCTP
ncbi:lateral flagellar hook associated protein 2 (FliD-like) [Escherichia coli]|uniref:Lateral flagellar hook associated protein 2 (FliD-like) n=1 Tax=Escherichia coli TaxID=562 RepID=A0A376L1A5_ECOLX|nr:lateral flagellar hook associated protein 2 (FliD-like) [Escherichia coli]